MSMLANVEVDLVMELSTDVATKSIEILVNDRYHLLENTVATTPLTKLDIKIKFPNTLKIYLNIPDTLVRPIRLEKLSLGGLALAENVLDQICQYTPAGSNDVLVTRDWHKSGSISIDFFAADWVQYHLLYGNKFSFKKN